MSSAISNQATMNVLVILVLAIFVGFSSADCIQSRPYIPVCSGHGQCINNTCLCDEGWTGRGFFINRTGEDCDANITAMTALLGIAISTSGIGILWASYRLYTFGKYKLWSSDTPHRKVQRIAMVVEIGICACFVTAAVPLFVNLWTDDFYLNVFSQMLYFAMLYTYYVLRARNVIPLAVYLLKSEHPSLPMTASRVLLVHIVCNVLAFCGNAVALNGIYGHPTSAGKDVFLWILFGVQFGHQLISGIILAAFYIILTRMLTAQLEILLDTTAGSGDAGSSKRTHNIETARDTVAQMMRANLLMLILAVLLLGACFIYPPLTNYFSQILLALVFVVASTGFLRFPPPDRDTRNPSSVSRTNMSNRSAPSGATTDSNH